MTTTEIKTLRNEYRALQIASGLNAESFRARVDSLLYELADGEVPVSTDPRSIVGAAREVSFYSRKSKFAPSI